MANLVNKAKAYLTDFKYHWNEPYKGRYIPNKEIVAYGIGGMGVFCATVLVSAIGLSASNLIVGSCIGLKPTHLYFMGTASSVIGFLITIIRSYIMDNVKSPMGKFRPFIKWMGVPTVLSAIAFVWMPYEAMSYNQKAITVFIVWQIISIVNPFYTESYNLLIQVMSPNSDERTDVMSLSQIIFSFAPTVVNLVIPFLATFTGGLTDLRTYRIIYPIISIFGSFIAFPVYKYTNERIIKPKSKENEVRFFDAIKAIVKNKYFWIINVAAWAGFLEMSYYAILQWTFVYAYPDRQQLLGVATTVIGNGALWAMIAAPFLIRKLGKRVLLISCNCLNILLLAVLFFTYHNVFVVIAIFYINNFVLVLGNIYNPGINADMRDYQQYISGERIDGMFGVVGLIGTFIGYFTGYVLPFLQERCGLTDNYDVLYDPTVRDNLFRTMIIASVVGATLNVIPFFFYDLTEKKHRGITYVLRIRAMFDDYSANCLSDETLVETMEIIENMKNAENQTVTAVSNEELKLAKAMPKNTAEEKELRSSAIKKAKENIYKQKLLNENIDLVPFVFAELNKFSTVQYQKQVELASFITENSLTLNEIYSEIKLRINEIKKPSNVDEKLVLADLKKIARDVKHAIKLEDKYGIKEFDSEELELAQNATISSLKETIDKKLKVRKLVKQRSVYKHTIKPFEDARKLLIQKQAYECMDELVERYKSIA